MTDRVVINGAFRPQRVTGQQRYATEIADRLLSREGFVQEAPTGRWAGSAVREWLWALTRLPRHARGATLVSLTSRAPIGVPQVLVVHDLFVLTNPEWYSRSYVATHAPALRAQLRSARAVIAVSEPVAAQARELFEGEVVVAPNAPSDVFRAPPIRDTGILDRLGVSTGEFLLSVGSADPRKNLPALAEAYERLDVAVRKKTPLILVGGGASIYRNQRVSWPDGMRTAGYVTDEELASLYRAARAVVFPSLAEGFGLPLVEAAAAGARGLVISDIPVFRWICGEGAAYIDPRSSTSIASGLSRAINGDVPPIAVDLDRFDWDASAAAVGRVTSRLAGTIV